MAKDEIIRVQVNKEVIEIINRYFEWDENGVLRWSEKKARAEMNKVATP